MATFKISSREPSCSSSVRLESVHVENSNCTTLPRLKVGAKVGTVTSGTLGEAVGDAVTAALGDVVVTGAGGGVSVGEIVGESVLGSTGG